MLSLWSLILKCYPLQRMKGRDTKPLQMPKEGRYIQTQYTKAGGQSQRHLVSGFHTMVILK